MIKSSFFVLSKEQEKQLQMFRELLEEKNKQINLLSRKQVQNQMDTLFEISLCSAQTLKRFLGSPEEDILDLGSGNGFPGLIYAILHPKTPFILCERIRKKAEFLKGAAFQLGLKNVTVLCENIENTGQIYKKIISQAAMPPEAFLKILEQILHKKGVTYLLTHFSEEKRASLEGLFKIKRIQHLKPSKLKDILQITYKPEE